MLDNVGQVNPFTGKPTYLAWQTPKALFDMLDGQFGFKVDAAADGGNHLCPLWYGPDSSEPDALLVEQWASPAFCNPPYGKGIIAWLDKFSEQTKKGVTTVALIPARTDTRWWFEGVVGKADITFLVGRVAFQKPGLDAAKSQPDHPSAICVYRPLLQGTTNWLDWKGK